MAANAAAVDSYLQTPFHCDSSNLTKPARLPSPISSYMRPQNNRAQVNFIKVELQIATTYCRLAEESDQAHLPKYLKNARKAYESVIHFLAVAHLNLEGQEFNDISANTERLKFALEAVERLLI